MGRLALNFFITASAPQILCFGEHARANFDAALFALGPQRRLAVPGEVAGADGNRAAANVNALASGDNTVQGAGAARGGRQAL